MPGGFPFGLEIANPSNPAGAVLTALTSNASANVKGSFVQLTAGLTGDISFLDVYARLIVAGHFSVDIAVGAAGSERVVAADMLFFEGNDVIGSRYTFPLHIKAGTPIAARCQDSTGNQSISVSVNGYDAALTHLEGAAGVDAIGFNSGTTTPTLVTSGASGVKGSWFPLVAAAARDYMGFLIYIDTTSVTGANYFFDIGFGAGGSEQAVFPNYAARGSANGLLTPQVSSFFPMQIPAGTRVSARSQDGNGSQSNSIALYGVYQ